VKQVAVFGKLAVVRLIGVPGIVRRHIDALLHSV